jgi:hypothetical protein
MDEGETVEMVEIRPVKHTRWSLLTLGISYAASIAGVTAEYMSNFSMMAAQHNLHKREEDRFYEVVKNG